jgi:hypothetical protein
LLAQVVSQQDDADCNCSEYATADMDMNHIVDVEAEEY